MVPSPISIFGTQQLIFKLWVIDQLLSYLFYM